MRKCNICKRPLDTASELVDCGGDCLECMAECGDPDAQLAMQQILLERSRVSGSGRKDDLSQD
jgi:hypothetical protein